MKKILLSLALLGTIGTQTADQVWKPGMVLECSHPSCQKMLWGKQDWEHHATATGHGVDLNAPKAQRKSKNKQSTLTQDILSNSEALELWVDSKKDSISAEEWGDINMAGQEVTVKRLQRKKLGLKTTVGNAGKASAQSSKADNKGKGKSRAASASPLLPRSGATSVDSGIVSAPSGRSSAASAALSVDDFLEAPDFYDFEENVNPSNEFYAIAEGPDSLSGLANWQKFQLCKGLPTHFAINPVYYRLAQEVLAVYQPKTDKEFKQLLGLEVAKIERAKKLVTQPEQAGAATAQSEEDEWLPENIDDFLRGTFGKYEESENL